MKDADNFLEGCLFFNTNALSRYLLKIAENQFRHLKLSPAHASLLLFVYDNPGISPKELSQLLCLSPSTITRFVDALVKKKLVQRSAKGKIALIHPTRKGLALKRSVALAYKNLHLEYTSILGEDLAYDLTYRILDASRKLDTHFKQTNDQL